MNQKTNSLKLLLLAAVTFGCTAVRAQDPLKAPPNPAADATSGYGLLGSNYAGLAFDYYRLNQGAPGVAHGFSFTDRTVVGDRVDTTLDYDWLRARSAGGTFQRNRVMTGLSSYAVTDWGKPFVEGSLGWRWDKSGGPAQSAFLYRAATGVEFKLAPRFAFAPYVAFDRAPRFNQNETGYGVRANFRMTRDWNLALRSEYQDVSRTSADRTLFSVGADYHF